MEALYKEFPCRDAQIQILENIFAEPTDDIPEALFVFGLHAVGKTSVITKFLETVEANFAIVNCVECYSPKLLFEPILKQVVSDDERKCDNLMDFLNYLQLAKRQGFFLSKHTVIVFDGIEYISQLGSEYFAALSRLQQLTSISSLGVIFISHILPEKFDADLSFFIKIYFPQYSKDELVKILMMEKPVKVDSQFYEAYLNAAMSVIIRATRDLNELRILITKNFRKYCEPMEKGLVREEDSAALWRHIVPHLRASILSTYSGTGPNTEQATPLNEMELSSTKVVLPFDLPFYSKYFLIAAFLASNNSAKHDKRLFVKNHGKQRKQVKRKEAKETVGMDLLGPKAFSLDRLLAIFYSIMEEKASLTASLMAEISTLVELRLMTRLGDGCLDKPMYKCCVGFQAVDSVARTVGFNVKKYLLD